jgi:EAL domain-containing protein (putative c-di-GMP-specific phosphodiesterase class I)
VGRGGAPAARAEHEARRLHARLSEPYDLPGLSEPLDVRFSVGVVVSPPQGRLTSSELYHQADLAAAAAKAAGGDAVVVFDAELRARTVTRLEMEDQLRVALGDGSVQPLYQPLVTLGADIGSDRVTGCEALARLSHEGRLVPPVEFIDVAEETGLIVDLDVAVFAEAVRQVGSAPPHAGFGLAVNLSPRSLQVHGLADRVRGVLGSRIDSGTALRFEITESCLAEPTSTLVENLRGLRELGGRIGLDDFGTGYSALSYLRRFDLDFMKIDRSFVADVCSDRRAASIVRAVIDLAHAHDLTVVAEGIETAEQLEALRHMRCDMVQGFHLGRPVPAADLMRLAAGPLPR